MWGGVSVFLGVSLGQLAYGAQDVVALWNAVVALDAGPGQFPRTQEEAREMYLKHVILQESAVRRFLEAAGASDTHTFEAQMRLARVLTIRAELEGKPEIQAESAKLLDTLEANGSREQKAEVGFTRISQWMRRNRFPDAVQRQELLSAVREFRDKFPSDRRVARLLVEVATRFDREPTVKGELLELAARATQDSELKKRIADDQARLALLGKPLVLRFTDLNGRQFRMEDYRSRPVVVLYFAADSQPSLEAWKSVGETLRKFPEVIRVGISLDEDRVAMERVRKVLGENWVIAWDGRGWMSSLARRWGVNVLPTVWLVDPKGILVSLDALEDLAKQLGALQGDAQSSGAGSR